MIPLWRGQPVVTMGNMCFDGEIGTTYYNPVVGLLTRSPLAAEIKIGPERIGARADGGLQICLPRNDSLVAWDRSYSEITLDVNISTMIIKPRQNGSTKLNAKRMDARVSSK